MEHVHRGQPDGSDLSAALVRLLQNAGFSAGEDWFVIKRKVSSSGGILFVIVATPGAEQILDSVLSSATGVDSCLPNGITVLTEPVAAGVIRYAEGRSVAANDLDVSRRRRA